ncbi:heme biosynthesis protein HemY [Microvirga alba]|uniref:Heme biosynthesis protein HemY n=1 Tax=Microvirga alba TaxID=2791025 RepID=A0A931BNV6_9HYPH|nr:heme biosynthesis HemY N-terminal domain-containing protein [Microvirga alba]MBF9232929.1 heme biosynthesis protein HemY [Microvirga alba]
MWRTLVFIGLLCVAAFGAVWLADRPGTVLVTFGGYEMQTSVAVAAVALVGLALALTLLWSVVTTILGLPSRLTFASRARRRARGYQAVSRGMVAVGAGDTIAARRYAGEAERLLGHEPLALLLKAQAAQVSGNRAGAEAAFTQMIDRDETRVLGLRGLFVEARRRGDAAAAREYAAEAIRLAPAASWASDAVLEARCADRDWRGALDAIERRASLGLVDKATAKRHRAVLLTADALDRVEHDPDGALYSAQEAVKLAPTLIPAAALAGRLLSHKGELRRAAKVVETAWRSQPHPDLAEVYLNLRPGDSALDRLKRADTLQKLSDGAPEGRLAVARAALESREFARARAALEPLIAERPTMRVCLLMSDLEQAEHGATGKGREWLARATRAPRDPAWIADGVVSEQWAPISPVTGRLDAFVWQAPPDVLVAPELAMSDDVTADLHEEQKVIPIISLEPAPALREELAPALPKAAEPPVTVKAVQPVPPQPEPVVFPASPPDVAPPEETPPTRRSLFR